jgi:hypothetical protein
MRRMLEEHPLHAPKALFRGGIFSCRVYSEIAPSVRVEHCALGKGSVGLGIHVVIFPGPVVVTAVIRVPVRFASERQHLVDEAIGRCPYREALTMSRPQTAA